MSSYRASFHDLSPGDQADIASFSERWAGCSRCCGEPDHCDCDEADFLEILAEQDVYCDE